MKPLRAWAVSALTAAGVMIACALVFGMRYASAQNALVMKAFAGYTGAGVHFHPTLGTVAAWLMYGLGKAFPAVPWYSVLLVGCLWFAVTVLIKSCAQLTQRAQRGMLPGLLGGLALTGVFGLYALCRVDAEMTAALLAAAAVMRLMTIDLLYDTASHALRGTLLSAGLLLACYCLSEATCLATLPLCLPAVPLLTMPPRGMMRPTAVRGSRGMLAGVLLLCVCLLALAGIRRVEMSAMGEYEQWYSAWKQLTAHPRFSQSISPQVLEAAGWTQPQLNLFKSGYGYGEAFNAAALQQLSNALGPVTHAMRCENAATVLHMAATRLPWQLWVLAALGVVCLLSGARAWVLTPLVFGISVGALWVCGYLGAAYVPSLLSFTAPPAALLLGHALRVRPGKPRLMRLALAAACAAVVCVGLHGALSTVQASPVDAFDSQPEEAVETYARAHPDKLIFYAPQQVQDTRLWIDAANAPQNIVLPDVRCTRAPAQSAQLNRFGLDARYLLPWDFLDKDVVVAGVQRGPWRQLQPYFEQTIYGTINWALYERQDEVCFYRLYKR